MLFTLRCPYSSECLYCLCPEESCSLCPHYEGDVYEGNDVENSNFC